MAIKNIEYTKYSNLLKFVKIENYIILITIIIPFDLYKNKS